MREWLAVIHGIAAMIVTCLAADEAVDGARDTLPAAAPSGQDAVIAASTVTVSGKLQLPKEMPEGLRHQNPDLSKLLGTLQLQLPPGAGEKVEWRYTRSLAVHVSK